MNWKPIYLEQDGVYKIRPSPKSEYPDEVEIPGWGIVRREKNRSEMTDEDVLKYGKYIKVAAKDIPLSVAMKDN